MRCYLTGDISSDVVLIGAYLRRGTVALRAGDEREGDRIPRVH